MDENNQDDQLIHVGDVAILVYCSISTARRLLDRMAGDDQFEVSRLAEIGYRRITRRGLQRYADKHSLRIDWARIG